VCNALARVAAFAAPYMILSSLSSMKCGLILGFFNLLGAAAAYMLPETADQYLDAASHQSGHRSSFSINTSRTGKSVDDVTSPILVRDR
jgi:hypothetical protein